MAELKPLERATRIIMAMRKELTISEKDYEELLGCFVDQEDYEDQIRQEEREAFIEIANNECSKLQDLRCILNAICKRGEK